VSAPAATRESRRRLSWSAAGLVLIAVFAIAVPFASPNEGRTTNFDRILEAPTSENMHWFGTDDLGRDLLVRTAEGAQVTLIVALVASLVSLVIGVGYGAIAGYAGGRTDSVMMRVVDTLYAMPFIFFVILLMVVFERNFFLMFVAIGAINWLDMARIVRGQTIALREREFVLAARLNGASGTWILARHIVPNLAGIVVVYLTLTIPQAILVESFLSFLGLGVQEPETSLGTLVSAGADHLESASWLLLIPGGLLAFLLLCFNFAGDRLRDTFDVRESR